MNSKKFDKDKFHGEVKREFEAISALYGINIMFTIARIDPSDKNEYIGGSGFISNEKGVNAMILSQMLEDDLGNFNKVKKHLDEMIKDELNE